MTDYLRFQIVKNEPGPISSKQRRRVLLSRAWTNATQNVPPRR